MRILQRLVMFLLAFNHHINANSPLQTVPAFDVRRYTGKWYEIARLPNRFQKQCASDVSATYHRLPSGDLAVLNRCLKKTGQWSVAKGIAWVAEQSPGSKLKVSFVPWFKHLHLFGGDYWILALDSAYQWSIVGSPDRQYLWILSRTPSLPAKVMAAIEQKIQDFGFDVTRLIRAPHTQYP